MYTVYLIHTLQTTDTVVIHWRLLASRQNKARERERKRRRGKDGKKLAETWILVSIFQIYSICTMYSVQDTFSETVELKTKKTMVEEKQRVNQVYIG